MDGHSPYFTHRLLVDPNPNPNAPGAGSEIHVERSQPPVKRKRGRPRKYGPEGSMSLAISPLSSGSGPAAGSGSGSDGQKRGRGRPPGSGRKQQLASLGEWVLGSAGMGFTPHVITISEGEDIAAKIMSFSQQGPRAVFILSANGAVSTVTFRQSETSASNVTYEGHFEILCLSGSYILTDDGGSHRRSGGLSISLSSPDGMVIGGGVSGVLLAARPVQIIVGSFMCGGGSKAKNRTKTEEESGANSELQKDDKLIISPCNAVPSQSHATSPIMGGWPDLREMDLRNPHINIDLMHG